MARYIIREGTVRGQGRYWTLAVETGRGVCFWDYGDPIIYEDRELARKAAGTVGGRVVRLITKAERLLAIEEQAKRVARAEKWVSMADLALLDANESDLWNSRDTWKRARAWENLCNEAWTMACSGFQSERRKLAEMVGEGDES